jgi:hypothetical protein
MQNKCTEFDRSLLADVDLALIGNPVNAIRDVDGAPMQIARGVYGECADCGGEIGAAPWGCASPATLAGETIPAADKGR